MTRTPKLAAHVVATAVVASSLLPISGPSYANPSAPSAGPVRKLTVVKRQSSRLVFKWKTPRSGRVASFIVAYSGGGSSGGIVVAGRRARLSGLRPSTRYVVKVAPANDQGTRSGLWRSTTTRTRG